MYIYISFNNLTCHKEDYQFSNIATMNPPS